MWICNYLRANIIKFNFKSITTDFKGSFLVTHYLNFMTWFWIQEFLGLPKLPIAHSLYKSMAHLSYKRHLTILFLISREEHACFLLYLLGLYSVYKASYDSSSIESTTINEIFSSKRTTADYLTLKHKTLCVFQFLTKQFSMLLSSFLIDFKNLCTCRLFHYCTKQIITECYLLTRLHG